MKNKYSNQKPAAATTPVSATPRQVITQTRNTDKRISQEEYDVIKTQPDYDDINPTSDYDDINPQADYDDITDAPVINTNDSKFINRSMNNRSNSIQETSVQGDYMDPIEIPSKQPFRQPKQYKPPINNFERSFYIGDDGNEPIPNRTINKQLLNLPKQENYFLCLYDTNSVNQYVLHLKRGDIVELIEEVSDHCFIGKFNAKIGLVPHKNVIPVFECITSNS